MEIADHVITRMDDRMAIDIAEAPMAVVAVGKQTVGMNGIARVVLVAAHNFFGVKEFAEQGSVLMHIRPSAAPSVARNQCHIFVKG